MRASITTRRSWVAIAAVILTLAACSRADNGDGLTHMQREDQAASASATGLFNFARAQISQGTNETSEPRAINGIAPQVVEISEPFILM